MTASADLMVKIKGDTSEATSALGKLKGGLGKVGVAAAAGAAVAGAAVVGLGAKGVAAYASFDKGMREVFTLMPGMSKTAMGKMEDDVLALSKQMGIMPEEIIPALYDSISAGVPPDNVMEFMQTAAKASIGGVTDLGTAVDGITSTINAFGAENITAAEASDLMFTAVKLGKTTMEELSSSLFQVNPVAAGLGVEFGDVTASLAALTAQGTPTRVAATQVRSALAELGKSGTKASDIFQEISGQTFADFIAGGGNVQEAFQMMAENADDMGLSVMDSFGSIEAGMAVQALTSETGAAAFAKAMEEMQNSAGATEDAFGVMDDGMARSWDKIKANAGAALIEIGKTLAPFVEQFLDWFMSVLPGALEWFQGALETVGPILQRVGEWLGEHIPVAIGMMQAAIEAIWPVVETVFGAIQTVIQTVVGWFRSDGAEGVGEGTSKMSAFFTSLMETVGPIWERIKTIIVTVMEIVKKVIELATKAISAIWENHGEAILGTITRVWDNIKTYIDAALRFIQGILDTIMGVLTGDWDRAWNGIKDMVGGVWDAMKALISTALESIKLAIRLALDLIGNMLSMAWNAIKTAAAAGWNNMVSAISGVVSTIWYKITGKINDVKTNLRKAWDNVKSTAAEWFGKVVTTILDTLRTIPSKLGGVISFIVDKAIQLGKNFIKGILNGLGGLYRAMVDKLKSAIGSAVRAVGRFFGISSPSKYTRDMIGIPLGSGIAAGLDQTQGDIDRSFGEIISGMEADAKRMGNVVSGAVDRSMGEIGNAIEQGASGMPAVEIDPVGLSDPVSDGGSYTPYVPPPEVIYVTVDTMYGTTPEELVELLQDEYGVSRQNS